MKKFSQRYIYEMVVLKAWDDKDPDTFYIDYHFEDYFTSRKAAFAFVHGFIRWMLGEKIILKAQLVNLSNKYGTQLAMYRVDDGEKIQYYGIVRNMILTKEYESNKQL